MFKIVASAVGLHAPEEKLILAARFELARKRFLKPSPLPVGLRERGDFRFSIADLRLKEKTDS